MDSVTDEPESRTESATPAAEPARMNDYDAFAEAYSAENEHSPVNAYYERPAMLTLAGDVSGRRILDAGCGSGSLAAALQDRDALVTGIDASVGMLAPATARNDRRLHHRRLPHLRPHRAPTRPSGPRVVP